MKTNRKVWASVVTLLAACLVHAADMKPIPRVISIVDIETDDPKGYAAWIAQYNVAAKAKLGIDNYLRVYQSTFDGRQSGMVRAVAAGKSVAELVKNSEALENDLAIVQNRDHLRTIRKIGARVLYQAVRYDGSDPGGSLYSTLAVVNDEAGYLQALDKLRAVLDSNGFKDAKINAYRVLAGRTDHSHRINVGVPSAERLGAMLDLIANNAAVAEWLAASAKFRTVVSNATVRDITK